MLKYTKEFINTSGLQCKRIYRMGSILIFEGFSNSFSQKSLRFVKKCLALVRWCRVDWMHNAADTSELKQQRENNEK